MPPGKGRGVWSIPAHTGKPGSLHVAGSCQSVYPRPHGEAFDLHVLMQQAGGLSPPTRGSLARDWLARRRAGSIPAHTGKPDAHEAAGWPSWVYPRPHGEAMAKEAGLSPAMGLSPPTRGSRDRPTGARGLAGSIPAHTGKPTPGRPQRKQTPVYPRPHGEAPSSRGAGTGPQGLSPPTRGSLGRPVRDPVDAGSIPAHTGKPSQRPSRARRWRVYPRPHGEAWRIHAHALHFHGLSPPTRGSPAPERACHRHEGSIPAHTGKPSCRARRFASARVYPRPHGEAVFTKDGSGTVVGLSPPTRGKPRMWCAWPWRRRVYPRPHGEAGQDTTPRPPARGLSPPTRGSLARRWSGEDRSGSIPAHTGKPSQVLSSPFPSRVYPRPHGEASARRRGRRGSPGLSPPTRGSRLFRPAAHRAKRSIPAHTGKPW